MTAQVQPIAIQNTNPTPVSSSDKNNNRITLVALACISAGIVVFSLAAVSYLPVYCYGIGGAAVLIGALISLKKCSQPATETPTVSRSMINGLSIPCFTTDHLSKVPADENMDAADLDVNIERLLDWYHEAYPGNYVGNHHLNNVINEAKGDMRLNRWLKGIAFYFERAAQNSEMAKQQRARVLADIAAADSCPPTKRRVVRQKYHEVVGGNADDRILRMVQEVKEDIILRYCQVERNIGQWHVISYIANRPLGRRLGLDARAAVDDEYRGCGYIDLDEVERVFQTEYTEEVIVHAITEKVNLEISNNPELRNGIQNHLSDTFKERIEAAGNEIDANGWLTQQGYCTYNEVEEEFQDPTSGEMVPVEVERLATITPKVAVLYLQKVGILQTQ